jgi:zinc transport system substrate-binding protein
MSNFPFPSRFLKKSLPSLLLLVLLVIEPAKVKAEILIVTTIRPLQLIAEAIVQEYGVVTSIVSGQQSPHQFTISPSDRRALGEADMLIWIGADFEIYLADFFEQQSRAEITLNTLQLTGLTLYDAAADQLDAHLWLDTGNASKIAEAVAERLSRLDEANASHYRQNLAHFRRGLENTNREISELLQRSPGRSYVVFHNAYQYFEKQFGLQHQFALLNDPETEPGIRQILSTRERISVNKPHCLLHEFTSSMELIDTMLDGYELKTVVVDLLGEKLSAEDGYIGLISNVAAKFSSCLY